MSNEYSVLIVDSNAAFATILKESLEQDGRYHPAVTASGDAALQAMAGTEFDLAIVDLGLTDPDGAELARTLRQQKPSLRLMLIPFEGEALPPELADLDVQGLLTRPFFFPELPARVAEALGVAEGEPGDVAEVVSPTLAPAPPVVTSEDRLAVLRENLDAVIGKMTKLSQEIAAEAVILTCGGRLLAHTGRLAAEEADRLAQVAGESWRTSARVAQILGREQLRFEQSVEGGEHVFYSLAVAEDIILSVALRANVRLGMIRHRAKETAETLRTLMGAA